jgi:hypothetical protein
VKPLSWRMLSDYSSVFDGVRVVHRFSRLCCVFCFVCLRPVSCVPYVTSVLCLVYPTLPLSCVLCTLRYLCHVSCVPYVTSVLCLVYPTLPLSFVLCTQCRHFLWIVHSWLHLWCSLAFVCRLILASQNTPLIVFIFRKVLQIYQKQCNLF